MQASLSRTLQALLVKLVQRICEVETNRGSVSKVARAKLAEGAQPYQDLIDRLLFISGIFAGRSHRYRRENGGARLTWHYAQRSMEELGRVGRDARTVTLQLHQRFSGATLKKPKKHAGGG